MQLTDLPADFKLTNVHVEWQILAKVLSREYTCFCCCTCLKIVKNWRPVTSHAYHRVHINVSRSWVNTAHFQFKQWDLALAFIRAMSVSSVNKESNQHDLKSGSPLADWPTVAAVSADWLMSMLMKRWLVQNDPSHSSLCGFRKPQPTENTLVN